MGTLWSSWHIKSTTITSLWTILWQRSRKWSLPYPKNVKVFQLSLQVEGHLSVIVLTNQHRKNNTATRSSAVYQGLYWYYILESKTTGATLIRFTLVHSCSLRSSIKSANRKGNVIGILYLCCIIQVFESDPTCCNVSRGVLWLDFPFSLVTGSSRGFHLVLPK